MNNNEMFTVGFGVGETVYGLEKAPRWCARTVETRSGTASTEQA